MKEELSQHELLAGIKTRDRKVLHYLYDHYYAMIRNFVLKNSGTNDDASDLFQEGLIVIFENTHQENLELKSSLRTYFYAVCRNKWLMVLRKRKNSPQMVVDTENVNLSSEDDEAQWLLHERYQLMRAHFKRLGDDCQRILKLFLEGNPLKEIAILMGFSEKYAKKRKFVCQQRLIESIEKDEMYKELLSD